MYKDLHREMALSDIDSDAYLSTLLPLLSCVWWEYVDKLCDILVACRLSR